MRCISIPIDISSQKKIELIVYSETDSANTLNVISEYDCAEFGEALYQLKEECSYEYKITDGYQVTGDPRIIKQSQLHKNTGRIIPGIYVGRLKLDIFEQYDSEKKADLELEVISSKASYRDDYRNMLEFITEQCTDLLMQHSSPVVQTFTIDFEKDPQTLYQRFAFLSSIIGTPEFDAAINRILRSPVSTWQQQVTEADIRSQTRFSRSVMRQLVSRSNRIELPEKHPLKTVLGTLPAKLTITKKSETADTPENRFIKHAVSEFYSFISKLRHKFKDGSRAYAEAKFLEEKLEEILAHSLFKEISAPGTLPLNSPVLQRKEGYREILRVWLLFDLAAKLIWQGGSDVYDAGKRDIAVLYEYWLFFKLLETFKEIFRIAPEELENLIETTSDGLGLKLKAGEYFPLKGIYSSQARSLNVQFSYNKTFSGSDEKNYPEKGSWSKTMRPDYTLSFWPAGFTIDQAEKQELIVHIHFDAKYKIEHITEIFGNDEIENEKAEQRQGIYKRADLLKMHAYKDAIRRTSGAYVLYPGIKSKQWHGFHEIIPGLGAFAIRPDKQGSGIEDLKKFIFEVLNHFSNRISQRERISYHSYKIFKNEPDSEVKESLPEIYEGERISPPDEVTVLVGYIRDDLHKKWIEKNNLYNARMNTERGALKITKEVTGARYLLLHSAGELISNNIWKITEEGPRVFSKNKLVQRGYPVSRPQEESEYLGYSISSEIEPELKDIKWDIRKLPGYKSGRGSSEPFAVTLSELMKAISLE